MIEAGVPQYNVVAWYGVHVPARTPQPIIEALNKELLRVLALPDVAERIVAQGMDPAPTTPEQFQGFVKSEVTRWTRLIADAGIKQD